MVEFIEIGSSRLKWAEDALDKRVFGTLYLEKTLEKALVTGYNLRKAFRDSADKGCLPIGWDDQWAILEAFAKYLMVGFSKFSSIEIDHVE